jgi:dihydrolipoamide dehydrogenase
MANADQYDVVIIGAGPGGYVAGIRAAQLGLRSCVIEKDKPGGVCLNWGCIPSKNLLHQAKGFVESGDLSEIGVVVDKTKLDYAKVQEKSRKVANQLMKGVEYLLKKNKVELIKGTAKIVEKTKVVLDSGKEITGRNILIATGSRPLEVPGFEFDETQVLSSNGILSLTKLPRSLVILGGGAIGCEFAYIMNAFGAKVTLVEMAEHLLPFEDEETVRVLEKSFKKAGIEVLTGTVAVSLSKTPEKISVNLERGGKKSVVEAEKVLCVFGRKPNTENLGLDTIGVRTESGFIPVGAYYQTGAQGVFAIGDVVKATPLLAHVASKEGEIAVEHMAGRETEAMVDINAIPSAIYCEPQLASFGLREAVAKAENINYGKAVFPFRGLGKAVAIGKADGHVKVLYHKETKEILGAHIVGENATELIHEILLAKSAELLPGDIACMIHAHPTLSESTMEVMRAVENAAIHC